MTSSRRERRLAALEQAQAREDRLQARFKKERQGEAARAIMNFACALVREGTPAQTTTVARPPPAPVLSRASVKTNEPPANAFYPPHPGESKEAHIDRLRGLLKGYQIDSYTALRLIDTYPELAFEKAWK